MPRPFSTRYHIITFITFIIIIIIIIIIISFRVFVTNFLDHMHSN